MCLNLNLIKKYLKKGLEQHISHQCDEGSVTKTLSSLNSDSTLSGLLCVSGREVDYEKTLKANRYCI